MAIESLRPTPTLAFRLGSWFRGLNQPMKIVVGCGTGIAFVLCMVLLVIVVCGDNNASLADARRGFTTRLIRAIADPEPPDTPPPGVLVEIRYPAPSGPMAAYITPPLHDEMKYPAIIWLFGGFSNAIGATAWEPADPTNDQSASTFRNASIVMMYPSLRGGCGNPGKKEFFYGEVDDVLAAADYLAKQPHVDPARIYLGGHSTGGTLALLVAESSSRFRAVFSFGPVANPLGYSVKEVPFNIADDREVDLRSPGKWLSAIRTPTFVFEGAGSQSNIDDLRAMASESTNPKVRFYGIPNGDHRNILAPVSRLIAQRILADTGSSANMTFTEQELAASVRSLFTAKP